MTTNCETQKQSSAIHPQDDALLLREETTDDSKFVVPENRLSNISIKDTRTNLYFINETIKDGPVFGPKEEAMIYTNYNFAVADVLTTFSNDLEHIVLEEVFV